MGALGNARYSGECINNKLEKNKPKINNWLKVRIMLSRLFQYLIFTFFVSIVCFIGFSLFLILISYILNWGEISLSEIKYIVLFFFNVFSKGFLLLFLSILISDNLKRR